MSTTLYGSLIFGYPIDMNEDFDYYDINRDWAMSKRPKEPEDDTEQDASPAWEEWRANLRKWESSSENIQIDFAGSEGGKKHYIHFIGFEKQVIYNNVLKVESIERPIYDDELLKEFCIANGLQIKRPDWFLTAKLF